MPTSTYIRHAHGLLHQRQLQQRKICIHSLYQWLESMIQLIIRFSGRLVESNALRKKIDATFSLHLPKSSHPWVYVSLTMDPHSVDVNVHPTKNKVWGFVLQNANNHNWPFWLLSIRVCRFICCTKKRFRNGSWWKYSENYLRQRNRVYSPLPCWLFHLNRNIQPPSYAPHPATPPPLP